MNEAEGEGAQEPPAPSLPPGTGLPDRPLADTDLIVLTEPAPIEPPQPLWLPLPTPRVDWDNTAYGGPPPRPLALTLASIYLMATGGLLTFYGASCGVIAFFLSTSKSQPQFAGFAPILTSVGIAVLVPGIASIAAGAGAMSGKSWARWIGVVVSILLMILGGLAILWALSSEGGLLDDLGSITVAGFMTVAYGLTAWAFVSAAPYFRQLRVRP